MSPTSDPRDDLLTPPPHRGVRPDLDVALEALLREQDAAPSGRMRPALAVAGVAAAAATIAVAAPLLTPDGPGGPSGPTPAPTSDGPSVAASPDGPPALDGGPLTEAAVRPLVRECFGDLDRDWRDAEVLYAHEVRGTPVAIARETGAAAGGGDAWTIGCAFGGASSLQGEDSKNLDWDPLGPTEIEVTLLGGLTFSDRDGERVRIEVQTTFRVGSDVDRIEVRSTDAAGGTDAPDDAWTAWEPMAASDGFVVLNVVQDDMTAYELRAFDRAGEPIASPQMRRIELELMPDLGLPVDGPR